LLSNLRCISALRDCHFISFKPCSAEKRCKGTAFFGYTKIIVQKKCKKRIFISLRARMRNIKSMVNIRHSNTTAHCLQEFSNICGTINQPIQDTKAADGGACYAQSGALRHHAERHSLPSRCRLVAVNSIMEALYTISIQKMNILHKKTSSFYVLSTSFLRPFYVFST